MSRPGQMEIIENHYESEGKTTGGSFDTGSSQFFTPQSPNRTSLKSTFMAMPDEDTRNSLMIDHIMSTKEKEFSEYLKFSLCIGTWNVNGQPPSPDLNLSEWLCATSEPPDVYAVGFQELDLSQQAFLWNSTPREQVWAQHISSQLHPKAKYRELKRVRLVGIFLLVYVKEQLWNKVTSVDICTVGTGLLGYMGNKGGVSVSFKLHDSRICFVNSHLAAHNDEVLRRNEDFSVILNQTIFPQPDGSTLLIGSHDLVVWMGDLNYRLQNSMGQNVDISMVKQKVRNLDYNSLLVFDQLKQVQGTKDAFQEFDEGPVTFPPTYKYDVGTNEFDSSEKGRCPAWCDRVLWLKGSRLEQKLYWSVQQICISDHKPVLSHFVATVKHINQNKYKRVLKEAIREADRLENEFLPQVEIDKIEFLFENVAFLQPQVQTMEITNVGQGTVEFTFKPKDPPHSPVFCRPWIHVTASSWFIPKGQKSTVEFQVLVDKEATWLMNGGVPFDDILVLHLIRGKDIFVSIGGNYVPCCFGMPLEKLITPAAVGGSNVAVANLIDLEDVVTPSTSATVGLNNQLGVPSEVYSLVEYVRKNGLDTPLLFQEAGRSSEVAAIREALCSGRPISGHIPAVVDTLVQFLDALPDAVVPLSMTAKCLANANNFETLKPMVDHFPVAHANLFRYLVTFFREVLTHFRTNGTNIELLATMFGPLLLRMPTANLLKGKPFEDARNRYRTYATQFLTTFLLTGA